MPSSRVFVSEQKNVKSWEIPRTAGEIFLGAKEQKERESHQVSNVVNALPVQPSLPPNFKRRNRQTSNLS